MNQNKQIYKLFTAWLLVLLFSTPSISQSIFKLYPEQEVSNLSISLNETSNGFLMDFKDIFSIPTSTDFGYYQLASDGTLLSAGNLSIPVPEDISYSSERLQDQTLLLSWTDAFNFSPGPEEKSAYIRQINISGNILRDFEIPLPELTSTATIPAVTELQDGSIFIFNTYNIRNTTGPDERFFVYTHYNLESGVILSQSEFSLNNLGASFISSIDLSTSSDGNVFLKYWDEVINQHYILKLTPDGTQLWRQNVSSLERPVSLLTPSNDGGVFYYIDAFEAVSKLDANGNFVGSVSRYDFQSTSNNGVEIEALVSTEDGGVILVGPVASQQTDKDFFTGRLGANMEILKDNRYTLSGDYTNTFFRFQSALRATNNDLVISGYFNINSTSKTPFLISLNESGEVNPGGFEPTFYQAYDLSEPLRGFDLEVTVDGYNFIARNLFLPRYQVLQTDPSGNITDSGNFISLPEPATRINSLRLSNGEFITTYPVLPTPTTPTLNFDLFDASGSPKNGSFQIEISESDFILATPQLKELEDGSIFIITSYALDNSSFPPGERYIVTTKYNPVTETLSPQQEFFWADGSPSFEIERIEQASDGHIFVHFWQSNLVNAHYISKLSPEGEELWRIQVATLERPPKDIIPTEDGGVWVWNNFFNSVNKYDATGAFEVSLPISDIQNSIQGLFEVRGIAPAPNNGIAITAFARPNNVVNLATAVFDGEANQLAFNLYPAYEPTGISEGFATPEGGYAFIGFTGDTFSEEDPVFIKTNSQGEIIPSTPPISGFEETFYSFYNGFPNLRGIDLEVGVDDYTLVTRKSSSVDYRLFDVAPNGTLNDSGTLLDLPEMSFFNSSSVRLSSGDYIVANIDDSNFPQTVPPTIFFNQYDAQGVTQHSFQVDLPANAVSLRVPEFTELEDGTIFFVAGYAEEALGPPVNSALITGQYNPVSKTIIQTHTIPWSSNDWNIVIERLEAASDGTIFLHTYQSNVVEGHFLSKLTLEGQELWRNQVTNLARPIIDIVPTEDGGVWAWVDFSGSITRYDLNGDVVSTIFYNGNGSWPGVFVEGIAPAPGNGLAVLARTGINDGNHLITGLFDGAGNLLIENEYEEYEGTRFFTEGFATPEGGYAFVGISFSQDGGPIFIKLDDQAQLMPLISSGPDLSLSITGSDEAPNIWANHSVTVTVTNEGNETANGIEISIPKAQGDVYRGGNEFSASQGSFSPYSTETWTLGSLAAGASATIQINYFKVDNNPFFQYAQVIAMEEEDADSTPGNGNGSSANEDDEAVYPGSPCEEDTTPPTISNCPTEINITTGTTPIPVFWEEPTFSDDCGTPTISVNRSSGSLFNQGSVSVTYTVTDEAGNTAQCSFLVRITDTGNPNAITCTDNLIDDSGFEMDFASEWQANGDAVVTSYNHSGDKAMEISTATAASITQSGISAPGINYELAAYTSISELGREGLIFLRFLDANMNVLSEVSENSTNLNYDLTTLSATSPNGTVAYEVGLRKGAGDFAVFADDWCLQSDGIVPPMEEEGCYFEEIYDAVSSNVSNRAFYDVKEDIDGNLTVRYLDLDAAFNRSVRELKVSANGDFLSSEELVSLPPSITQFVTGGYFELNGSNSDLFSAQLKTYTGSVVWGNDYQIPEATQVYASSAAELEDGSYLLTGSINKADPGLFFNFYLRVDASGMQQQLVVRPFGFSANIFERYELSSDSHYYLQAGQTGVVKLDLDFNEVWRENVGDFNGGNINDIAIDGADNVYIAATLKNTFSSDPNAKKLHLTKVSPEGLQAWIKIFFNPDRSFTQGGIIGLDEGVIFSTIEALSTDPTDVVFNYQRVSADATTVWEKTRGDNFLQASLKTQDGSLLFIGTANSPVGQGNFRPFPAILKTTSDGNLVPLCNNNPIELADLTLENLSVPSSTTVGSTLNYTFTLKNIGTNVASGDFNIKAYFSVDDSLSPDDIFDGLIPTGNIAAGQTIDNVQGASIVPNLPNGTYYLILKVDADENIDELNETNNTISQTIVITSDSEPADYCEITSDFPWHEWISNVSITNQGSNSSGKSVYSDFTNLAPLANLEQGRPFGYIVDITYSYFTYFTYIYVYTDFNQNGIFENEELSSVAINPIPPGNNVVASRGGTDMVPEDAKLGLTRTRVIISRNQVTVPCGSIAFGEIEDYTVNIVPNTTISTRMNQVEVNEILTYPNPVNNELSIEILNKLPAQTIQLFDAYGNLKKSVDIDQGQEFETTTKVNINTTDLINGVYFLQVNGDRFKPRTKRIVIQRTY